MAARKKGGPRLVLSRADGRAFRALSLPLRRRGCADDVARGRLLSTPASECCGAELPALDEDAVTASPHLFDRQRA